MTHAFFDVMLIIATMCQGAPAKLDCVEEMSSCVDDKVIAYTSAELQTAYISCLRKQPWKN